jgi:hypothetical protein
VIDSLSKDLGCGRENGASGRRRGPYGEQERFQVPVCFAMLVNIIMLHI